MRPPSYQRNDSNSQQPTGPNLNFDANAIYESDFHAQVVRPTGLELESKFTKSFSARLVNYLAPVLVLCSLGIFTTSAFAGTPPETPQLEVTSKTATEVSFRGVLNPGAAGEPGHYEFLYNKSPTECEHGSHSTPGLSFGVQGEEYPETISSLEPGATYTACLQVENAAHEKAESPPVTFTLLAEAPLTSTPAQSIHPTTAVLEGTLNPLATGKAGWHFAYSNPGGSSCTEGPTTAQEAEVEGKALPEHKEVTGLEPGQTYVFCLVATNELGETTAGNEVTFTTEAVVPVITAEYPSEIEPETTTLNASIDPGGAATTYHFEYLTQAQFEADGNTFGAGAEKTPESASIGADNTEHQATASLEKLLPGTTYHYRAVATNSQAPAGAPGPDATFATPALPSSTTPEPCPNAQLRAEQPYGLTLPDCRAYEMVSPLDKDDNDIEETDARASESGEAIAYGSAGSFSEPAATDRGDRYISRRTPQGWSAQNITPPDLPVHLELNEPFEELWFTPSLSAGLLESENDPLTPVTNESPRGYPYLYLANTGAGASASSESSYQLVNTINDPELPPYYFATNTTRLYVDGASTDLSHVVFGQEAALIPGAAGYGESPFTDVKNNVYEWAQGSRELHLVNVPPPGKSFAGEGGSSVGTRSGGGAPSQGDVWHAVSADASRVFFTAIDKRRFLGQLYVRENPEQPPVDGSECAVAGDACTIEISESQRTGPHGEPDPDPHGNQPDGEPRVPRYWGANAEGSKVFFTSRVELTNDANTKEDAVANLYECELVEEHKEQKCKLTDLTPENAEGAAVLGLVTASEDGEYVYFVAEGKLAQGATSGQPNMYLYHAGHTSFIATLAPATENAKSLESLETGGDSSDWAGEKSETPGTHDDGGPGQHTVRVTPDGTTLAFESQQSLTGYDNEPARPQDCVESGGEQFKGPVSYETPGLPCREVYVYDATTGRISCASCDPSGARPIGPAKLGPEESGLPEIHRSYLYEPHNLSEDGDRLFFETPDPLVPHDSDGASGCPLLPKSIIPSCQDVYEWELPATAAETEKGESSCTQASADFSPADGGCVFPISDVAGDHESFFLDATPSGDDVFIATADQLVPSDTDDKVDVYDVRSGGGFPVTPAPPVCDNADSCKSPETPQPTVFGAPASATFAGPANPPPPPPVVVKPAVKPKPLTRAQKLAAALKACKKDKKKDKRKSCEATARKKYGAPKKAKKASHNGRAK